MEGQFVSTSEEHSRCGLLWGHHPVSDPSGAAEGVEVEAIFQKADSGLQVEAMGCGEDAILVEQVQAIIDPLGEESGELSRHATPRMRMNHIPGSQAFRIGSKSYSDSHSSGLTSMNRALPLPTC